MSGTTYCDNCGAELRRSSRLTAPFRIAWSFSAGVAGFFLREATYGTATEDTIAPGTRRCPRCGHSLEPRHG